MPATPLGTTQACCQPSTTTGVSRRPASVAAQPELAFSWTCSRVGAVRAGSPTSRVVESQCDSVTGSTGCGAAASASPSDGRRVTDTGRTSDAAGATTRVPSRTSTTSEPHSVSVSGASRWRAPRSVLTVVRSSWSPTRSTGPTWQGTVTRNGGVRGCAAPTTVSSLTPTGSRLPASV